MKFLQRISGAFRARERQQPFDSIRLVTLFDEEHYVVDKDNPFVTIGRNETNTIVLPDERVSRLHCRIDYEEGIGVQITDYSRNGTWITDSDLKAVIQLVNKSGWFQIREGYLFLGLHPASGFNMTRIRFTCT